MEKQKDSKPETDEGKNNTGSASTSLDDSILFLHFLENQTDERSAEAVGLPNPDDAIILQASLPPEGHHWAEPLGGVQLHTAAADARTRVDEVANYADSLQQLQKPPAEPHDLPNPDDTLAKHCTQVLPLTGCNRRRRMEEPEEAVTEKKR